jgi:hypothetical protein
LLKIIGIFIPLRYTDAELEEGDAAVHDEEVEPPQSAVRTGILETMTAQGA